jgi:chromate transporter
MLHQELVVRQRWISERRFLHALNYCMVLPGPEAQQLVTYMGWLMHKTWGGLIAGALFVLPSLGVLVVLSWLYVTYADWPWISHAFAGIKPAIVAIVVHAAYRIGGRVLTHPGLWVLSLCAFVAMAILQWPFALILAGAAAIAWLWSRMAPEAFKAKHHLTSVVSAEHAKTWIDDDTPLPPHAQGSVGRSVRVVCVGLLLWALPLALVWAVLGGAHLLTDLAWFFTKAALLTFGGAYAVLPYVHQGAVLEYAWLSSAQMMDGLALGETTPGPLIMVVAFVGFLAGHAHATAGSSDAFAWGLLAAAWVTWFTFLPSFVFILAGAPWVERTQNQLDWTAPLAGVSAAVVGVIAHLALSFAQHGFWPQGWSGPIQWGAVAIAVLGLVALVKFKRSVLELMVCSALAGLILHGR